MAKDYDINAYIALQSAKIKQAVEDYKSIYLRILRHKGTCEDWQEIRILESEIATLGFCEGFYTTDHEYALKKLKESLKEEISKRQLKGFRKLSVSGENQDIKKMINDNEVLCRDIANMLGITPNSVYHLLKNKIKKEYKRKALIEAIENIVKIRKGEFLYGTGK